MGHKPSRPDGTPNRRHRYKGPTFDQVYRQCIVQNEGRPGGVC